MLARVWKIIAANGVAAILFGFVLVLWPDIGLTTIVAVVAVYALVRGVLSGLAAFSAPLPRAERGWLTLEAVAGTAIGIALLVWNDISAKALLYVVAAWAIAIGVLMLAAAIQLPLSGGRRLLLALNGLVAGAFGAVMFIEPDAGAVAIVALIAAFTIVIGIMQVGFALELRNVAADVRRSLSAAEHHEARGARLTSTENESGGRRSSRRPPRGRQVDRRDRRGGPTRNRRPFRFLSRRPWPVALTVVGATLALTVAGQLASGWLRRRWDEARRGGRILSDKRAYARCVVLPQVLSWCRKVAVVGVLLAAYGIPVSFQAIFSVLRGNALANLASLTPGGVGISQAFNVASLTKRRAPRPQAPTRSGSSC